MLQAPYKFLLMTTTMMMTMNAETIYGLHIYGYCQQKRANYLFSFATA